MGVPHSVLRLAASMEATTALIGTDDRPLRVLFTGSRMWDQVPGIVVPVLEACFSGLDHGASGCVRLVHGAAKGADSIADATARTFGWEIEPHPVTRADYALLGRWRAPLARDEAMVALGADLCVGLPFADGMVQSGTRYTLDHAHAAGIPTFFLEHHSWRTPDWQFSRYQPAREVAS